MRRAQHKKACLVFQYVGRILSSGMSSFCTLLKAGKFGR